MNNNKNLFKQNNINTIKNIEEFLFNIHKLLKINENLMLTAVMNKKISKSYYNRWLQEVNLLFPLIVYLNYRIKKYQNQNNS